MTALLATVLTSLLVWLSLLPIGFWPERDVLTVGGLKNLDGNK